MRKGGRDIRQFYASDGGGSRIDAALRRNTELRSGYTRIYLRLNRLYRLYRLYRLLRLRPAELNTLRRLRLLDTAELNPLRSGRRSRGYGLAECRPGRKNSCLDAISDDTQCLVDVLLDGRAPWLEIIRGEIR